jgi:hypothetical protein
MSDLASPVCFAPFFMRYTISYNSQKVLDPCEFGSIDPILLPAKCQRQFNGRWHRFVSVGRHQLCGFTLGPPVPVDLEWRSYQSTQRCSYVWPWKLAREHNFRYLLSSKFTKVSPPVGSVYLKILSRSNSVFHVVLSLYKHMDHKSSDRMTTKIYKAPPLVLHL